MGEPGFERLAVLGGVAAPGVVADTRPRVYVFGSEPERLAGFATRLGEHGYKAETFGELPSLHLALSLRRLLASQQ